MIGIVKGDEEGLNYMIPIDFADGLIAHLRIKEMRARLSELEGIVQGIVRNPQRTGQDRHTDCPKIKGGEERYTLVLNQEVTLLDGKFRVRLTDMRSNPYAIVGTIHSNAFSQRPIRNREAIGFVINKCKYTMLALSMKLDSVEIAVLDY